MTALVGSGATIADEASPTQSSASPKTPPNLARRIGEITEAALKHHIDPPTRQQMILDGIKALHKASGTPVPPGLSRRVSGLATPEQFAAFLAEIWPTTSAKTLKTVDLEKAVLDGLLGSLLGGARLLSAKESKVEEQFEGNRYVGLHIHVGTNAQEKCASIQGVIEGGPAARAGVMKDDLIEQIDGAVTKGMTVFDVIDRLRGEEGTPVTITLRQPTESTSRTMTITRGQLAHPTISGVRKQPSGNWEVRLGGVDPIGYLKINEIAASTPHELRKMASHLENQGARALVLDLRGPIMQRMAIHPAVLLADCLLELGLIGRVRTAQGETTYKADADALFRGWPIAVLVDRSTSGAAEWLAAALQDNRRAVIVGTPTFGAMRTMPAEGQAVEQSSVIRSRVPVGDGSWSIELATARLERGDGRPLSPADAAIIESETKLAADGRPAEIKTGIMPDYPIAIRNTRARPALFITRVPPAQRENSADLAIEKAVELLRESLKTALNRVVHENGEKNNKITCNSVWISITVLLPVRFTRYCIRRRAPTLRPT